VSGNETRITVGYFHPNLPPTPRSFRLLLQGPKQG
jgi:hypothetical protein